MEVGLSIGATLGKVEKVDANTKGFCLGSCLRVRVLIDISKPLCRGRKVHLGEHGLRWVDLKYERLPIYCYLCGKVDHDERDCMQWVRSKDTLRPEEKQFGPWLRATPDRVQKPQIITATTNGETNTAGNECETPPERRGNEAIPRWKTTQPGNVISEVTEEVGITRADVMKAVDTPTNTHPKAPIHLLPPNFEQQIRDIDAAIHRDVPGLISEPGKEMMLTGEENMQPHTDSRRVKEEWAKAIGPNIGNQS